MGDEKLTPEQEKARNSAATHILNRIYSKNDELSSGMRRNKARFLATLMTEPDFKAKPAGEQKTWLEGRSGEYDDKVHAAVKNAGNSDSEKVFGVDPEKAESKNALLGILSVIGAFVGGLFSKIINVLTEIPWAGKWFEGLVDNTPKEKKAAEKQSAGAVNELMKVKVAGRNIFYFEDMSDEQKRQAVAREIYESDFKGVDFSKEIKAEQLPDDRVPGSIRAILNAPPLVAQPGSTAPANHGNKPVPPVPNNPPAAPGAGVSTP